MCRNINFENMNQGFSIPPIGLWQERDCPNRDGHRRHRGAWGRPQRVPVKLMRYKGRTEMRVTPKNQGLTCSLQADVIVLPKTENDPRVDTHLW